MIKIFLFLVLFFSFDVLGLSIDEQILKIRNASAVDRVKLVNQLKVQIFRMNQNKQLKAIQKIQRNRDMNNHTLKNAHMHEQILMNNQMHMQGQNVFEQNMNQMKH